MLNIFAIAFMFVPTISVPRQAESVEWQLDGTISMEDRDAILALSKQMGIEQPRRISILQVQPIATICRLVRVESPVVEEGNRRSWSELSLLPPESSQCLRPPRGAPVIGRWTTLSARLEKHEEWRIRDNQWYLDVSLGAEVPYSDAELIALAIRRGELVNRLSVSDGPLNSNSNLADINPNSITAVQKASTGIRTYQVRTGQERGFMLDLRVLGGSVELYSYSTWDVVR
jgi:hypothetical protein